MTIKKVFSEYNDLPDKKSTKKNKWFLEKVVDFYLIHCIHLRLRILYLFI